MTPQPLDLAAKGYAIMYRTGRENACPGCTGEAWYVGRRVAECARCHLALPLQSAGAELVTA